MCSISLPTHETQSKIFFVPAISLNYKYEHLVVNYKSLIVFKILDEEIVLTIQFFTIQIL